MRYHSPQAWRTRSGDAHKKIEKKLVYSTVAGKKIPNLKQFKYIGRVLPPLQMWLLRGVVILLVANVFFLSWKYYETHTVAVAKDGGGYTEGLVGSPQYINPLFLQSNDVDRDIAKLVYSGLTKYDDNRTVMPDLAERYELSSDSKTYTFYLRHDVQWHDGEPFTADDVAFTISRIQDPATKSPLYLSFRDVKINKVDDYTIQLGLPKPYAPFLNLTTIGVLPQHVWADVASENFSNVPQNTKPIGTGAWKFKTLQKGGSGDIRSYIVEKNDTYYGSKPYLNAVTFKFYPDIDSAVQALKNRKVDGISFLPRDLRANLEKETDLAYYTFNLPQYTSIFFNQTANADLKTKAIRQALALSIDKDRIVREVLNGEGEVISAPILKGFLGYNDGVKTYPFDLTKAMDLLSAAGWKKNDEGKWYQEEKVTVTPTTEEIAAAQRDKKEVPKERVEIQQHLLHIVLVTVNQQESAKAAQIVKEGWDASGVDVEVRLVDPSRVKSDIIDSRDYDAFLYGEIIGSDPDLYPFWHSSQSRPPGLNLAVFNNPTADKLLVDARQISDPDKRAEMYIKFQDILAEEAPAVFLYNPNYNYVVSKKVQGIADEKHIVDPSDRFNDIPSWHVKTRRIWK
ncbi:MAG: ABC transporter substrate-binding protein [bacterium]|nr:ABC transporter substrate-binding protein [bacterium]